MKNVIKNLTLAVVIAMATTSAQATWTETVTGYWNSACTRASRVAEATENFFASNYFFATNFRTLKNIAAKAIGTDTITQDEYKLVCTAIDYSTLTDREKESCCGAFQYAMKKEVEAKRDADVPAALPAQPASATSAAQAADMIPLPAAVENLKNILRTKRNQYIVTTAATVASMAALYAYKRLTAKPSVAGWC